MKKDLGVKPYLFPMPTLMIATYNEDGTPDSMMMAWGGIRREAKRWARRGKAGLD